MLLLIAAQTYILQLNLFPLAIDCSTGMVFQQCGSLCPQTCDNIEVPCQGGCAEGCFCPDGQVLLDGECVDPFRCTGQCADQLSQHNFILC